jgi:hypothetical protein
MRIKLLRVIEQLRHEFKGIWKYDVRENAWIRSDGMRVEPRSHLAPISPNGDDDNFVTRYWRVDTNPMRQVTII